MISPNNWPRQQAEYPTTSNQQSAAGRRDTLANRPALEQLRSAAENVRQQAPMWWRKTRVMIAQHPELAIGAAVLAGVTFGWIVRRR